MAKLTQARKEQNKANVRNFIKGSFNVAVCLLNKDFREDLVDYVISTAKSDVVLNNQDLKQMQFNPAYVVIRRAILNALDTVELNVCVDEEQLNSEALKGHLRKSIDLTLDASGWTREEFDAIHNRDYSAMTITSKCAFALSHPKEKSIFSEGMVYINMVLEPLKASYTRLAKGYEEVTEKAYEESRKFPENEKYELISGVLVAKEHVKNYKYFEMFNYLTDQLSLNDDNAFKVINVEGTAYHLPTGTMHLFDRFTAKELSYDDYNQAIAELIADTKQ